MKILFCLLCFLISLPTLAKSSSFRCQLEDLVVLSTEDGKPHRYSGFEDSYSVGDSFVVQMDLNEDGKSASIEFGVFYGGDELMYTYPIQLKIQPREAGDVVYVNENLNEYSISDNFLMIVDPFNEFKIKRYYKGDWHGIWKGESLTRAGDMTAFLGTVNCLGISDEIDPMYERIFNVSSANLIE